MLTIYIVAGEIFHVAYLLVHSLAVLSWSSLLERYWVAMVPTRGSAETRKFHES